MFYEQKKVFSDTSENFYTCPKSGVWLITQTCYVQSPLRVVPHFQSSNIKIAQTI